MFSFDIILAKVKKGFLMIKNILIMMLLASTYLMATMNVQTASKTELMSISGIGAKKADAIIKYRTTHKLKSADDLVKVKGVGKGIVKNVKGNVKNKAKSKSKNTSKTTNKKMKNSSKSSAKKTNKKITTKKSKTKKVAKKKKQKKVKKSKK